MKKHLLLLLGLVYLSVLLVLESNGLINQSLSHQIPTLCLLGLYAYNLYLSNKELPDIRAEVEQAFKKRDDYLQGLQNDLSKVSMSVTRSGAINEKIKF